MPTIQLHATAVPSFFQLGMVKLREDIAFANAKGERKSSLEKQTKKTAEKLQSALQHLLEPEETILLIGNAQAPMSGLERYSFGWMAQYIAKVVLVVTEKRLLALRVTGSGKWDNKVRACKWQDVESLSARGWLSKFVRIQIRGGRKFDYWGVSRPFAAVLNLLAPQLIQQSAGSAVPGGEMVSLCPECKSKLTVRVYEC